MIYQSVDIGGFEIIQDRYGNCTVCVYSEECYAPGKCVLAAESHFVTGFKTSVLKQNMYAGYALGQFAIGYPFSTEIGQCRVVPMTAETVFIHFDDACGVHVTIRSSVN